MTTKLNRPLNGRSGLAALPGEYWYRLQSAAPAAGVRAQPTRRPTAVPATATAASIARARDEGAAVFLRFI
jgi:hypothetical protein